jgi:phospholipase/carboxylesterase
MAIQLTRRTIMAAALAMAGADAAQAAGDDRLKARPSGPPTQPLPPGRHVLPVGRDGDTLLFIPTGLDPATPAPMVLALHGAYEAGPQMYEALRRTAERRKFLLVTPTSRGETWDISHGGLGKDDTVIDRTLTQAFQYTNTDPARIACLGMSDGASYALTIGLLNGDLFSDVIAFSAGMARPARLVGRPRVYMSHGTHDTVLPFSSAEKIAEGLKAAGYDVVFQAFDGGHEMNQACVDAALDRFLLSPPRKS